MATTEEPQLAMDEKVIDSTPLESALEARESKKKSKQAASKQFKEADDIVKGLVSEFELADGEVARVGAFRIEQRATPGGSRAFDVNPGSRLLISRDKDPSGE